MITQQEKDNILYGENIQISIDRLSALKGKNNSH